MRETELAGVEKKVQARVRKQIEQNQKDYFLREQIKAIQTELGDKDATDVEDLRERLAKTPMNDEARDKANRELERRWRSYDDMLPKDEFVSIIDKNER